MAENGPAPPKRSPDRGRETRAALACHYRFVLWLVPILQKFSRSQRFLLGDRIQRTAMDVLDSLVEATHTGQHKIHLARASLGIEKLRFLMRLAHDFRHLDERRYEHAVRSLDETGRRIGALMKTHRAHQST